MARRFRHRYRVLVGYCTDSTSNYTYAVLPVSVAALCQWRWLILNFQQRRTLARGYDARLLYEAYSDYTPAYVQAAAIPGICDEDNASYDYEWKTEDVVQAQAWQCVLDRGSREQLARCDWSVIQVREDSVSWESNEKYCDNTLGTPTLYLHEINQLLQTDWFYD